MIGLGDMVARAQLPPQPPRWKQTTLRELAKVMTPTVLDALAPVHRWGRYGDQCSDADPCRGLHWTHCGKDWRCLRCVLLNVMSAPDWDDTDADIKLEVEGV